MNLVSLKYFIEVYNTQSLTVAAQNLFVTQPTISLSLKKLEELLDTKLFTRSGSAYYLTETGEIVYREGSQILKQMESLHNALERTKNNLQRKTIRLGMTAMYSLQFMDEISRFTSSHNNVQLNLIQDGSYNIQQMLADDLLDIAIVSFPNFQQDKIIIEPLETTTKSKTIYVVMPKTNPLSQLESVTFKDLENQRFSSLTDNFIIGRMLKKRTRDFGYEANVVAYHNDLQILLHSLIQSNSICLLPNEYRKIDDSTDVEWVRLEDKYSSIQLGIGTLKNRMLTEDILEFIKIIKEN